MEGLRFVWARATSTKACERELSIYLLIILWLVVSDMNTRPGIATLRQFLGEFSYARDGVDSLARDLLARATADGDVFCFGQFALCCRLHQPRIAKEFMRHRTCLKRHVEHSSSGAKVCLVGKRVYCVKGKRVFCSLHHLSHSGRLQGIRHALRG